MLLGVGLGENKIENEKIGGGLSSGPGPVAVAVLRAVPHWEKKKEKR